MQTLQELYLAGNQLSRPHETTERTASGDHVPQLRSSYAYPISRKEGGENQAMSKITPGKKRYVKRQLTNAQPTILIGKNGTTPELIKEIEKQLQKETMVKVKLLKTALAEGETKQIATRIAQQIEATIVEVRGHTFMMYKPRKK